MSEAIKQLETAVSDLAEKVEKTLFETLRPYWNLDIESLRLMCKIEAREWVKRELKETFKRENERQKYFETKGV